MISLYTSNAAALSSTFSLVLPFLKEQVLERNMERKSVKQGLKEVPKLTHYMPPTVKCYPSALVSPQLLQLLCCSSVSGLFLMYVEYNVVSVLLSCFFLLELWPKLLEDFSVVTYGKSAFLCEKKEVMLLLILLSLSQTSLKANIMQMFNGDVTT